MRPLAAAVIIPIALVAGCASTGQSSAGHTATLHSAATTTSAAATTSATTAASGAHAKAATGYSDWTNYHRTPAKQGHAAAAVKGKLAVAWTKKLDGSAWSEPVIAGGILIAGTEANNVYGLNPNTGKVVWRKSLGAPEPGNDEPCGDILPIGITGSPAYDPKTGSVFVVATTGRGHHTLWALNAKTGAKRWHRNVDVDKARDRNAEQQRAALVVVDKRVILTYGAHAGDCGNYVGYAASVSTSGKGKIPYYAVPNNSASGTQSGMWSPAGPVEARDGNILTPTANGSNRTGGKWDHSDGVLELNPVTMKFVRGWAPANWEQGDADDQSLSSTSPVSVDGNYVVGGKRGIVWLLKPALGGVNGQLVSDDVNCGAYGGEATAGKTVILPCKYGDTSVLALTVGKKSLHTKWRTEGVYGSPIVAGNKVYVSDLETGDLKVLSLKTGRVESSVSVGALPTFPSEVVDNNHVFVPTLAGITAVRGTP